jgi:hypothetical protein
MKTQAKHQPIAVVGVAALFPGSIEKDGFWRDILAGRDLVTDVPASHWLIDDYYDPDPRARDKTYCKRGAFLPEVDFDPVEWGVPPSILPSTDTNQLLALIVAQQVLEDACGGSFKDLPRDRVSVILGVTSAQELLGSMVSRLQRPVWVKALREMGLAEDKVTDACERIAAHYVEWQESSFPGILGNVVAGRIANRLDLGGTNCVTDAACASSLSALSMAMAELHMGHSDLVITGGADTMNDIFMYICFSKTPALSPTGDCRPFSDGADGTLLGEGSVIDLSRCARRRGGLGRRFRRSRTGGGVGPRGRGRVELGGACVRQIGFAVGRAGYARWPRGHSSGRPAVGLGVGEKLLLARRRQAGHGPTVRWRTGWGEALTGRPQALVAQEALDAFGVADQSAQLHAPAACRALVDGQPEREAQELGPPYVPTPAARRRRLGGLGERRWSWGALWRRRWRWGGTCRWVGGRGRNDQRTPMGRGREDSTIDGLVLLRGRHGTGQAGQQRERIHVERVGAI